jgi:hypothetical protein
MSKVYHPYAPARTATAENARGRTTSVDPKNHFVVPNTAASASLSSQPYSLRSLQAAIAATGNSSSTSLTSHESPRFYPSAATTSSSFIHTGVAFPIDDPGASSVTVPDGAALTVASRKKARMITAPSASAVAVARGTDHVESLL